MDAPGGEKDAFSGCNSANNVDLTTSSVGAVENLKADLSKNEVKTTSSETCNIELLSKKFLSQFEPDLKRTDARINDIQQNQSVLIESLHQETGRLHDGTISEIETSMLILQKYRMKLHKIKKDMATLKDISQRLRKDAWRLQQQKEKEEIKNEEIRDKTLSEERKLVAEFSPDTEKIKL